MVEEYIRAYFPVLASWAMGCGGAYSLIQTVKLARRDAGAAPLSNAVLRIFAFLLSGGITTVVAYRLFRIPEDDAVLHGALVGVLYPVIMTWVMGWLKEYKPAIYDRMRVRTGRRKDDPPKGPLDTQEFF